MDLLNLEPAYTYMDSRTHDVEAGAVIATHIGFMDFADDRAGDDRLVGNTPLDMLLLLKAAAIAFDNAPIESPDDPAAAAQRVVNQEQADRLLSEVSEDRLRYRAGRFVDAVLTLSKESPCDQDLLFLLSLFLKTIRRCTPEVIESGEFGRLSRRPFDPDNW